MAQDDAVTHYILYSQTVAQITTYSRRVEEGKDIMAASEFARWVLRSGLVDLCRRHAVTTPYTVDGDLLRHQAEDLVTRCNRRFATRDTSPAVSPGNLESIHGKLDLIAGHLARLTPALPCQDNQTASQDQPGANVLPFPSEASTSENAVSDARRAARPL